MAFEILPPWVDLLTGRGHINMQPYIQANSSGWYIQDRLVLPGRWNAAASPYPCPGDGQPVDTLPRIMSPNGGGAVPLNYTDWMEGSAGDYWPLVRTTSGWKVKMAVSRRDTFSESRFGDQLAQQMDMRASSDVYLVGNFVTMGARCAVPVGKVRFAKTATAAVSWARKAGMTHTTYGGVKRSQYARRATYEIFGSKIGSDGAIQCGKGLYKIFRVVPA
jgi:hypothetical protein